MSYMEIQNILKIGITVYGRVTQSDIIGAVFGQTEDVLGESLELRHLQKDNKIGRIEVEVDTSGDVTKGVITIPSSLDKVTNVIIAAALETIQKIGPCKASARVLKIEDIKEIKIREIIERAKKVLEKFMSVGINSSELIEEVISDVNISKMEYYGKERIPIGPKIKHFDEVIFVETLDELKNLLRHDIKNAAAFEDMSKKEDLIQLASEHEITVFVNRGREFLVKKLMEFADVDNIAKADPGKRIANLTSKELLKSIRNSVACKQFAESSMPKIHSSTTYSKPAHKFERRSQSYQRHEPIPPHHENRHDRTNEPREHRSLGFNTRERDIFKNKLEELKDSNSAYVLDHNLAVLGKVPIDAIKDTIRSLFSKIHSIIVDGNISRDLIASAEKARVKFLVGKSAEGSSRYVRVVTNL